MFPAMLYCTKNGDVFENPGNVKKIAYKLELVTSNLQEEEHLKFYALLKMLGEDTTIFTMLKTSEDILVAHWHSWLKNPMKSHYKKYEIFNKSSYELYNKDIDVSLAHYKVIGRNISNPIYIKSLQKRNETLLKYKQCEENSNFLISVRKNRIILDEEYILNKIKEECKKYDIKLSEYVQILLEKKK